MNFSPNLVFLNRSFDKKRLKALLLWFRLNLSESAALEAVEILQGLGFRSATQGAISLGLDDLKTPTSKNGRVFQAQLEVALAHHEHHRGNRTPVELFQHLVDTWHRTSQDLTTEVVQLFHSTERVNPVYMMAFSGARGNLSQVRQLVGMRGLMADPRGQIVGFPILSNFREGLTITEYFVSCYGARKGVVDTAIRTADAGYLTRRLADVSHHFVVRTTNCGTHRTICLRDIKEGQKTILPLASRLVGRVLGEHIPKIAFRNQEITPDLASKLASQCTSLQVRSPLSCSLRWGVCQLCYGWGLSEGRRVTLGEAVGIIAAQSIGEPGTQLTLRTFHTGGVFSGDLLNEIRAPYNGTVFFPSPLQGLLVRTPHGQIAFLTKVSGKMILSFSFAPTVSQNVEKGNSAVNVSSHPLQPSEAGVSTKLFSERAEKISATLALVHAVGMSVTHGVIPLLATQKPKVIDPRSFASTKVIAPKVHVQKENKEFSLQPSTVIFVRQKEQVTANQLLAEFSSSTLQPISDQIEVTQQVLSESAGQVWFKEIEYGNRKGPGSGSLGTHFSSQKLGGVWVLAGKPRSEIILNDRQHFPVNSTNFVNRTSFSNNAAYAQCNRLICTPWVNNRCITPKRSEQLQELSSGLKRCTAKKRQIGVATSITSTQNHLQQNRSDSFSHLPVRAEAMSATHASSSGLRKCTAPQRREGLKRSGTVWRGWDPLRFASMHGVHNVSHDDHSLKYHYLLGYSQLIPFLFAEKRQITFLYLNSIELLSVCNRSLLATQERLKGGSEAPKVKQFTKCNIVVFSNASSQPYQVKQQIESGWRPRGEYKLEKQLHYFARVGTKKTLCTSFDVSPACKEGADSCFAPQPVPKNQPLRSVGVRAEAMSVPKVSWTCGAVHLLSPLEDAYISGEEAEPSAAVSAAPALPLLATQEPKVIAPKVIAPKVHGSASCVARVPPFLSEKSLQSHHYTPLSSNTNAPVQYTFGVKKLLASHESKALWQGSFANTVYGWKTYKYCYQPTAAVFITSGLFNFDKADSLNRGATSNVGFNCSSTPCIASALKMQNLFLNKWQKKGVDKFSLLMGSQRRFSPAVLGEGLKPFQPNVINNSRFSQTQESTVIELASHEKEADQNSAALHEMSVAWWFQKEWKAAPGILLAEPFFSSKEHSEGQVFSLESSFIQQKRETFTPNNTCLFDATGEENVIRFLRSKSDRSASNYRFKNKNVDIASYQPFSIHSASSPVAVPSKKMHVCCIFDACRGQQGWDPLRFASKPLEGVCTFALTPKVYVHRASCIVHRAWQRCNPVIKKLIQTLNLTRRQYSATNRGIFSPLKQNSTFVDFTFLLNCAHIDNGIFDPRFKGRSTEVSNLEWYRRLPFAKEQSGYQNQRCKESQAVACTFAPLHLCTYTEGVRASCIVHRAKKMHVNQFFVIPSTSLETKRRKADNGTDEKILDSLGLYKALTLNMFWQPLSLANYPNKIFTAKRRSVTAPIRFTNRSLHKRYNKGLHFCTFAPKVHRASCTENVPVGNQKLRFVNQGKRKGQNLGVFVQKPIWLSIHISNNNLFHFLTRPFTSGGAPPYPLLSGAKQEGVLQGTEKRCKCIWETKKKSRQIKNKLEIIGKRKRVEKNESNLDQHIVHTVNLPIVSFPYIIPSTDHACTQAEAAKIAKRRSAKRDRSRSKKQVKSAGTTPTLRYHSKCGTPIQGELLPLIRQSFWREKFFDKSFSLDSAVSYTEGSGLCIKDVKEWIKNVARQSLPFSTHAHQPSPLGVRSEDSNSSCGEGLMRCNARCTFGAKVQKESAPQRFTLADAPKVQKQEADISSALEADTCNVHRRCKEDVTCALSESYKIRTDQVEKILMCIEAKPRRSYQREARRCGAKREDASPTYNIKDVTTNIFKEKHLRISDIQFAVSLPVKIISNLQGRYTSAHLTLPKKNLVSFAPLTNKPKIHNSLNRRCKAKFLGLRLSPTRAEKMAFLSYTPIGANQSISNLSYASCYARRVSPMFAYALHASKRSVGGAIFATHDDVHRSCNSLLGAKEVDKISHTCCYRLMQRIVEYPVERSILNRWLTTRRRKLQYSLFSTSLISHFQVDKFLKNLTKNLSLLHSFHAPISPLLGYMNDAPSAPFCTFAPEVHRDCTEGDCTKGDCTKGACHRYIVHDKDKKRFMNFVDNCLGLGSCKSKISAQTPFHKKAMIKETRETTSQQRSVGVDLLHGRGASVQPFDGKRDETNALPIRNKVGIAEKKFTSFDGAIFLDWYAFPLRSWKSLSISCGAKQEGDCTFAPLHLCTFAPEVHRASCIVHRACAIRADSTQSVYAVRSKNQPLHLLVDHVKPDSGFLISSSTQLPQKSTKFSDILINIGDAHTRFYPPKRQKRTGSFMFDGVLDVLPSEKENNNSSETVEKLVKVVDNNSTCGAVHLISPLEDATHPFTSSQPLPFLSESDQITFITNNGILLSNYQKHTTRITIWQSANRGSTIFGHLIAPKVIAPKVHVQGTCILVLAKLREATGAKAASQAPPSACEAGELVRDNSFSSWKTKTKITNAKIYQAMQYFFLPITLLRSAKSSYKTPVALNSRTDDSVPVNNNKQHYVIDGNRSRVRGSQTKELACGGAQSTSGINIRGNRIFDVHRRLYSCYARSGHQRCKEDVKKKEVVIRFLRSKSGMHRFQVPSLHAFSQPLATLRCRADGTPKGSPSTLVKPTYTYLYPGQLVTYGEKMDQKMATTESGQVLYLDSQRATLRKAQTVLIYSQAIISVLSGEWIKKSTPLMALSYQKLVTGDIVQGLPKIEQFFEAPLLKDGTFWSDSLQAKLNLFFQEYRGKFPLAEAVRKGFSDIQRVLVEGVQRVYISQGVLIADKHLEVIVRQMTCKGRILYSGDTGFLRNELVALDKIESVNQVTYGQKALYHPQVRGITDASLESESFLSAASFQETTRVLSRDAVIGKTDLMRGLKERVIVGELIQAGTGLTNNSVYSFLLE